MSAPSEAALAAAEDVLREHFPPSEESVEFNFTLPEYDARPIREQAEDVLARALDAFAADAVEREREACAEVCDERSNARRWHGTIGLHVSQEAANCAIYIRARGGDRD